METFNYNVLEGTGYNGYILKDAPVKVMQFGEGNFLRAFVDYFYDGQVCLTFSITENSHVYN